MTQQQLNSRFNHLITLVNNENWPVIAMEVYQNGELLHTFGDISGRYPLYSITKSIVSIAFGIAEEQCLINLKDSILKYIPGNYIEKLSNQQKELFQNITLERLLTMSVQGFDFRPATENFLLYSLNAKIKPDEICFNYSNINAYLVSVALTSAVKKPLYEFIKEYIFDPMEIDNPPYQMTEEGYFYGATGMKMSVHELSKIGLMLINHGKYKDKKIVSSDYIKRATSEQIKIKEGYYGYFFWGFCNGFSLNGKWGQKCFCIPSENVVISVLADFQNGSDKLKNEIKSWFQN